MPKKAGIVRQLANLLGSSACLHPKLVKESKIPVVETGIFILVAHNLSRTDEPLQETFLNSMEDVFSVPGRGQIIASYVERGIGHSTVPRR